MFKKSFSLTKRGAERRRRRPHGHRLRPSPLWSATLAILLSACGPPGLDERVIAYRVEVEQALERAPDPERMLSSIALPDRRARRLQVDEQRIGPFDFLATLGCPVSELVAERNGPLGRVLEPTRRLDHELRVVRAVEDCLPTLAEERAARLRERLAEKQANLAAHVWNAVWLDEDLERFLSAGPRALIGGEDPSDGGRQLERAARALEARDVASLEAAFAQLRDDPAVGPLLDATLVMTAELERVARILRPIAVTDCDRREARLARIFVDRFVPLQAPLGDFDRRSRELFDGLERLFEVSARAVPVPEAMQTFRQDVLGGPAAEGLWSRHRGAFLTHAAAWGPILRACRVIPGGEA